jgi:hypothetical protein
LAAPRTGSVDCLYVRLQAESLKESLEGTSGTNTKLVHRVLAARSTQISHKSITRTHSYRLLANGMLSRLHELNASKDQKNLKMFPVPKGDIRMSLGLNCAVFAYLITAGCAIILLRGSSNWRIKFLAFVVGLLPLCHAAILLSNNGVLVAKVVSRISEPVELTISALCLTAVYLLSKENRERRQVEVRLRLAEAQASRNGLSPAKDAMAWLARTLRITFGEQCKISPISS